MARILHQSLSAFNPVKGKQVTGALTLARVRPV
jgi:hypothetical protein